MKLLAVRFNCDLPPPAITALNIRKNFWEIVPLPEWQAGFSVNAAQSPALYATNDAWGRSVQIQAQFALLFPGISRAEVRAIPRSPLRTQLQWWEDYIFSVEAYRNEPGYFAWRQTLTSMDHVLGEVEPRWIKFPAGGVTGFETFELKDHRLWTAGINIHQVEWNWQFRESSGLPWRSFGESRHRIYTVLRAPTAPWFLDPFTASNTQLPWTDVLDYACRWAAGALTPTAAATALSEAIYDLGGKTFQYGCPILAYPQYSGLYFDCTAFLERMAGGFGNGPYVNCMDCATFVSNLANILGCDLWQAGMIPSFGLLFETNPIRVIGTEVWQTPCGVSPGFNYHEVAWEGNCSFHDGIFDACLELNGNLTPALPPFTPFLATGVPFAPTLGRGYRSYLVPADAQNSCVPSPTGRQRRPIV